MDFCTFRILSLTPDLLLQQVRAPAFASCSLVSVAEALAGEDQSKKVIELFSLLCNPGNQVSHFLPEKSHVSPSLHFIINVPREGFLVTLEIPGQI